MQLISKLIPREYRSVTKIYRSVILVSILNFTIIFFSAFFALFFYYTGFQQGAIIMSYSCIVMTGFFILLNVFKNLSLCGIYFTLQSLIISTSLMVVTGGVISPFVFWLFGIGPISFLYFKERKAIICSVVALSSFLIVAGLQVLGFDLNQGLSPNSSIFIWAFMFTFVSFIFIAMVRSFQSGLKRINYKLKASNANLKISNEELERFAYIASHDLKSPLRNITSFVSLIERRCLDQLSTDGQEYFQVISHNARHMNNLIEDILEFSQVNSKSIKKEKVELNKVIAEISDILLPLYKTANIYCDDLPVIEADYVRIEQVFQNLIENGLKYNQNANPQIRLEFENTKDGLSFKVIDNGIGIEEEYHEQIFKMFARLHNQSEFQGTGIGLAVCKKVVHNLGGEISIEPNVEQSGSTFHLLLPQEILVEKTERILVLN